MTERSADPYKDFLCAMSRMIATHGDEVFWFTREVILDCADYGVQVDIAKPSPIAPSMIRLRYLQK